MAQLLVRGLEQETYDRLKETAKANGRSLEAEVRQILRQVAQEPKRTVAESGRVIRQIQQRLAGRQQTDSVDLVREDRDR
jgi:antitoxin FitA